MEVKKRDYMVAATFKILGMGQNGNLVELMVLFGRGLRWLFGEKWGQFWDSGISHGYKVGILTPSNS